MTITQNEIPPPKLRKRQCPHCQLMQTEKPRRTKSNHKNNKQNQQNATYNHQTRTKYKITKERQKLPVIMHRLLVEPNLQLPWQGMCPNVYSSWKLPLNPSIIPVDLLVMVHCSNQTLLDVALGAVVRGIVCC